MKDHLSKGLKKLARQLDIEFAYTVANHKFELGLPLENSLKSFFEQYFPRRYSFGSGYLVDSSNKRSNQCDWIIYDALHYAPLQGKSNVNDGVEYFPFDSAYAVIEVKRTLTKKALNKALTQIAKTKKLSRTKSSPLHINPLLDYINLLPGKTEKEKKKKIKSIEANRLIAGIYAYDEHDLGKDEILNYLKTFDFETLPDFVAVHGRFLILKVRNYKDSKTEDDFRITRLPQQYNAYACISSDMTSAIFYTFLLNQLNNTFLSAADYMNAVEGLLADYKLEDTFLFPGKIKDQIKDQLGN